MQYVAQNTETIAPVSMMDLSVEAEAFGAKIKYSANEVPTVVGQLIEDADAAEALEVLGLDKGRASTCIEVIRLAKHLIEDKPVLAGMIGPYSLADRLLDVTEIMYACYDDPDIVLCVLKKVMQYLIVYGKALREADADGVMIAEPLAGLIGRDLLAQFSVPFMKRIIEALQTESFAVIYQNCENAVAKMLDLVFSQGADAYHFGNSVDIVNVLENAPKDSLLNAIGQEAHNMEKA